MPTVGERVTYQTRKERERARKISEAHRREREGYKKNATAMEMMRSLGSIAPPIEVLFDRERRLRAPRTPNMIVLGDPCFEQSALGKMSQ